LEARTWLEGFLADYRGGVLLVSHDRYFLDVTIKEVYELFSGKLSRYPGSYSAYENRRAKELEAIFEAWERQQEEIQKIEEFVRRFRYKESKAAQVQSRIKMLEKIVPIEIPEGMKKIHFKFPPAPRSGKITVKLENLGKSYGSLKVIDNLALEIERGKKIAFVGPNGAGKSTLMRIIAGVDGSYEGSMVLGSGVEVGYFAQDSAEKMSSQRTVEEEAESVCPNDLVPKIRNMLGAFLFRGDDVEKPVSVLSGGERSRLALLKMLLHPANLLVLDEPTNHLDLTSKDVLLDALRAFEGTVLFVSHDRGFIEELADLVLELEAGSTPRLYYGDYRYYLEKKKSLDEEYGENPGSEEAAKVEDMPKSLSWEEEKARKARIKKLKRREEEISGRLESLSKSKKALEDLMALPANYSDGAKVKKIIASLAEVEKEAASLNEEWLEVVTELGEEA
jgi:ATP-binding cassette subfamily F protein 3